LGFGLFFILLLFHGAFRSIFSLWETGTYSHGLLVLPISIWLIWRDRKQIKQRRRSSSFLAVVVVVLLASGWLVGELAHANLLRQFSVMAMIPALVWGVLGSEVALAIWYPLFYLIFAVPMGDSLIPRLQDLTAWFTVSALQATGIPALLEGRLIYVSSGTWEVAQACSGIRYLIASVVLGTLFAHLAFRSWRRKLAFLSACVAVPIVANWIRAYTIILFAHTVSKSLAMGIDHVIYGWIFFSFLTVCLLGISLAWSDKDGSPDRRLQEGRRPPVSQGSRDHAMLVLLCFVVVTGAVRLWADNIQNPKQWVTPTPAIRPISVNAPWKSVSAENGPSVATFGNADREISAWFSDGYHRVQVYAAYYAVQRPGAEMIVAENGLKQQEWRELSHTRRHLGAISLNEAIMSCPNETRLVWYWYWVDGRVVARPDFAKLLRAKAEITGRPRPAGAIFVSVPIDPNQPVPYAALSDFLNKSSLLELFRD
jgi:exosortase A